MEHEHDVIIIGGGLAGLVSSMHLTQNNLRVVLFEQKQYPFHRVCGEYISNEVLPYLKRLQIDPFEVNAKRISEFELTSPTGKKIAASLPLGGFSISRYTFDQYIYQKSKKAGTDFIHKKVTQINFEKDRFQIKTSDNQTYYAKMVLSAYGKKSGLDNFFKREFTRTKSKYIGVKYHAKYEYPDNLVGLHNFKSGYCGVSQIENGYINICYLTTHENIKKAGNIENLEKMIMSKNRHLGAILKECEPVFDAPLTISNVCFDKKSLIEDHSIMIGDTAGMISPLCGNGMTMAIHSGKIAAEEVTKFVNGSISRDAMEKSYQKQWKSQFSERLFWGRQVQKLFGFSSLFELSTISMKLFPALLQQLIKRTHGKPIY